jgi:hypothetical protein
VIKKELTPRGGTRWTLAKKKSLLARRRRRLFFLFGSLNCIFELLVFSPGRHLFFFSFFNSNVKEEEEDKSLVKFSWGAASSGGIFKREKTPER